MNSKKYINIIDHTIDLCKLSNVNKLNFFVKALLQILQQTSNFIYKCPHEKASNRIWLIYQQKKEVKFSLISGNLSVQLEIFRWYLAKNISKIETSVFFAVDLLHKVSKFFKVVTNLECQIFGRIEVKFKD